MEDEEIKKNKKEAFKNITENKMNFQSPSSSATDQLTSRDNMKSNKASLDEIIENQQEKKSNAAKRGSLSILDPFQFTKKILNNDPGSFRRKLSNFIEKNTAFNFLVFFLIFANIVVLCLDRARLSPLEDTIYNYIDEFISIYFGVELVVRLYAFGFRAYFKDYFEKVDCVIITINIMEVIYMRITGESLTKGFSNSLQILRIFRFFATQKIWKSSAILFMEMMKALYNIRSFFALILVFITITSLVGEELFAYRVRFDHEENPTNSE